MATNLNIDPRLLTKAQKIGHHRTKRETVNSALEEYIRRRQQLQIFRLAGSIDYEPRYNYKKQRSRR
jgi:Arc/MetJ family transcription regulator